MTQNNLFGDHDYTRRETLMYLDDLSLERYSQINKAAAKNCDDEIFWWNRIVEHIKPEKRAIVFVKPILENLSYKILYMILVEIQNYEKTRRYHVGFTHLKEKAIFTRHLSRKLIPRFIALKYQEKQINNIINFMNKYLDIDLLQSVAEQMIKCGEVQLAFNLYEVNKQNISYSITYLPENYVKQIAKQDHLCFDNLVRERAENMDSILDVSYSEVEETALEELEDNEFNPVVIFRERCFDWSKQNILAYIEGAKLKPKSVFTTLIEFGQFETAYEVFKRIKYDSIENFINQNIEEPTASIQSNLIDFLLLYKIKFGYDDLQFGLISVNDMYRMERHQIYPTRNYLLGLTSNYYAIAISILRRNKIEY